MLETRAAEPVLCLDMESSLCFLKCWRKQGDMNYITSEGQPISLAGMEKSPRPASASPSRSLYHFLSTLYLELLPHSLTPWCEGRVLYSFESSKASFKVPVESSWVSCVLLGFLDFSVFRRKQEAILPPSQALRLPYHLQLALFSILASLFHHRKIQIHRYIQDPYFHLCSSYFGWFVNDFSVKL